MQGINDIVTRKTKDHLTSDFKSQRLHRMMANRLKTERPASSVASNKSGRYIKILSFLS